MWVDTDDIDPNYPSYPTVVYSPTAPSGLSILDVGTIWVDENFPSPLETVVPAVLYQSACPSGLTQNDIGYLWVDSDADIIEYNMNNYVSKEELAQTDFGFNAFNFLFCSNASFFDSKTSTGSESSRPIILYKPNKIFFSISISPQYFIIYLIN
jgi:hypothetical protein